MFSTIGLFEAVVLGIVQGLTEFLPISSSAHLRIVGALVPGWGDSGAALTAISQLGTETAVLVYFWRDITSIVATFFRAVRDPALRREPAARLGWFVVIGSIPIGVLGLAFQDQIESTLRNLWITAAMLIGFGLVIGAADRYAGAVLSRNEAAGRAPGKTLDQLTLRDGIVYGLAQALALVPGVSRSGGTISAGLFLGYTRVAAARYSFLLALPAVYLSGLFELRHLGEADAPVVPTVVATVLAGLVGFVVIRLFLRYVSRNTFTPFVVYRIALGVLVVVLLATGAISATAGV